MFYNHRLIIDSKLYGEDSEPRAWLISKVNRISPNGICRVTLTQDLFDQHKDYIERDEDGNVIGMWADYWTSEVEPAPIIPDTDLEIVPKITYTGQSQIRIGGSYKTYTVAYYDADGNELPDIEPGIWRLFMDGEPVSNSLVQFIEQEDQHKLKFKFLGDDAYIGKVITITNVASDVTATLDIEITAL